MIFFFVFIGLVLVGSLSYWVIQERLTEKGCIKEETGNIFGTFTCPPGSIECVVNVIGNDGELLESALLFEDQSIVRVDNYLFYKRTVNVKC